MAGLDTEVPESVTEEARDDEYVVARFDLKFLCGCASPYAKFKKYPIISTHFKVPAFLPGTCGALRLEDFREMVSTALDSHSHYKECRFTTRFKNSDWRTPYNHLLHTDDVFLYFVVDDERPEFLAIGVPHRHEIEDRGSAPLWGRFRKSDPLIEFFVSNENIINADY